MTSTAPLGLSAAANAPLIVRPPAEGRSIIGASGLLAACAVLLAVEPGLEAVAAPLVVEVLVADSAPDFSLPQPAIIVLAVATPTPSSVRRLNASRRLMTPSR